MRDIRLDPQPGDILRQKEGRYPEREVTKRERGNVVWTGATYHYRYGQRETKMRLASWRNWAKGAEVVREAI